MNEKFILVRQLHLGHVKDTFRAGAVIEHDEARGMLIIDGRKFDDTRDLDILARHEWIVPYSDEMLEEIKGSSPAPVVHKKPKPGEGMKILQSDEDLMDDPIDISDTQVSKRNQEAKEASRNTAKTREKDRKMEIIKGDETVEERLASLKDKTDINSMSERVRLKREKADMPIIQDDSLGMGVGKSEIPRNAGQHLPSREEVEAKTENSQAIAAARKTQVEKNREQSDVELPEGMGETVESTPQATPEAAKSVTASEVDQDIPEGLLGDSEADLVAQAENVELKAENAELKGQMSSILDRLASLESPKPKRGPGRPKKTTVKKAAKPVVRIPVEA